MGDHEVGCRDSSAFRLTPVPFPPVCRSYRGLFTSTFWYDLKKYLCLSCVVGFKCTRVKIKYFPEMQQFDQFQMYWDIAIAFLIFVEFLTHSLTTVRKRRYIYVNLDAFKKIYRPPLRITQLRPFLSLTQELIDIKGSHRLLQ